MVDCDPNNTANRFVCPNDRQLALRAKLKTGWSVKTASLDSYPSSTVQQQPLGADEQAAIVDVIKRAEEIELTEQERVGRLVERLENMRRNALGRTPSQCLLCGDNFRLILGGQKVICMDCRRLVCQKCAIDSTYSKKSMSSYKNAWLCLICAETREIWKKSGAWFFKSIPKYILPCEKLKIATRNGKNFYRDEDSSSDEERRIWNKIHRRNSSTESTHAVHEPIPDQLATAYQMSNYSRQTSSCDSQISKELGSMSVNDTGRNWEEFEAKTENPSSAEVSRRDSMVSRSLSEWNWSTTDQEKISPSVSSSSGLKVRPGLTDLKTDVTDFKLPQSTTASADVEPKLLLDTSMGTIELSLNYDPITTTLHCTVYRAKNLIPMDINGLSDPFCKLNILPNTKMSTRLRTKTVHKTRNPEFNENLTFYDITENDLMKKSLHVLVVDDDKYGHDYMGETRVNLAKLKIQNTVYLTLPLEKLRTEQKGPSPAPELNQWFDDLWSRGQILLSLCYSTKRRALLVTVCRCVNLLPMDNNGFSDPFVKLQLRPDPYHRKHKTSIKWKNLNPIFNEEFAFETRPTELSTQNLFITVYDKDYGKSNDYLGGLIVGGNGSKGQRLKHWLDMIRYPDHRHEAWHNLTEDILDK